MPLIFLSPSPLYCAADRLTGEPSLCLYPSDMCKSICRFLVPCVCLAICISRSLCLYPSVYVYLSLSGAIYVSISVSLGPFACILLYKSCCGFLVSCVSCYFLLYVDLSLSLSPTLHLISFCLTLPGVFLCFSIPYLIFLHRV